MKDTRTATDIKPVRGLKIHNLTLVDYNGIDIKRRRLWHVRCDCGEEFTASWQSILKGDTECCQYCKFGWSK